MPRYVYECESCKEVVLVVHSIKERLENCRECSGVLNRLPSMPTIIKKTSESDSAGQRVRRHIEDAKRELAADCEEKRKEIK